MAGSADASPLLTLLDEASALGRPALALSHRRVAELLGLEPDDRWWAEHADAWRGVGWQARLGPDAVTFVPAAQAAEPVEVRLLLAWDDPAGPPTRVAVDGREVDPLDADVAELARLAARIRRAGGGGGSGI